MIARVFQDAQKQAFAVFISVVAQNYRRTGVRPTPKALSGYNVQENKAFVVPGKMAVFGTQPVLT
jgi:hypothetical protein